MGINRDPRTADETSIHAAIVELLQLKAHRNLIYFHPANGEERSFTAAVTRWPRGLPSR